MIGDRVAAMFVRRLKEVAASCETRAKDIKDPALVTQQITIATTLNVLAALTQEIFQIESV